MKHWIVDLFGKLANRKRLVTFRSSCFVLAVGVAPQYYKICQILFSKKDGSLFVNFPYFKHSRGLVSVVTLRGGTKIPTNADLKPGGKVTSHLVKYAHHPNGRVHFSQAGQVLSQIKKQSLPLGAAQEHIFTIQLQGLTAFDAINPDKDLEPPSEKRTVLKFQFTEKEPAAIKLVGRWYSYDELKNRMTGIVQGPRIQARTLSGQMYNGFLLSPPLNNPMSRYILLVICEAIPILDKKEPTALTFIGGFDPPDVINNLSVDTKFLALSYPASNYRRLLKQLGSIDYMPQ